MEEARIAAACASASVGNTLETCGEADQDRKDRDKTNKTEKTDKQEKTNKTENKRRQTRPTKETAFDENTRRSAIVKVV